MKFALFLNLIAFLITSSNSYGTSLEESYQSALKINQIDNINNAQIEQSVEIKNESTGKYYPVISARGTYQKLDNVNIDQKTIGLNLTHSIYRGGRDKLLVDSAGIGMSLAKNQKEVDRSLLYQNVIQAYYNYYLYANDQTNLELLRKLSADRVDETGKRVRIGRTRRGELLQAEAQLASALAQILNGSGLVKESQERFFLLTGLSRADFSFSTISSEKVEMKSLDYFLDMAFKREDVKNKELKVELADLDVSQNKAQYLPTLDLNSNYYFNKRNSTTFRDSKWDIGLTLNFPLFEGGANSARVRESVQKKDQAFYTLLDLKKNIEIDVTSKYESYRRYNEQIKSYDMAMQKAKSSYDEALKDYRLGLVSNLDTLSSLNLYLDSKRNSEKTKILALMSLKLLEAAAGVLP